MGLNNVLCLRFLLRGTCTDVIVGPGCSRHSGNSKFRQFTKAYKRARFQTNPQIETEKAVSEVVAFWRNLSPRGRFLTQSKSSGQWEEVDDTQAMRIASFFLMNNNQRGELKRQKSLDAIKESKKISSGMEQPLRALSIGGDQGQLPLKNEQQLQRGSMHSQNGGLGPDMLADLEPVPIGRVSSAPCQTTSDMAWGMRSNMAPPTQDSFENKNNRMLPPQPQKPLGKPKIDDEFGDFDFNPIPMGSMGSLDELDPLPFGMPSGNGPLQQQQLQQQQQLLQQQQDQVQLSVNMVVPGSANFQLTTDTGNGVIQISAQQAMNTGSQEQAMGMGMGMMNPISVCNNNGNMRTSNVNNTAQPPLNEYQINVFGANGGCDNNGAPMFVHGNNNGSGSPTMNPIMINGNTAGTSMNPMMVNAQAGNNMIPMMMHANSNNHCMNPMMMKANGHMNPLMNASGIGLNPMLMNGNDFMNMAQQQGLATAQNATNGNMTNKGQQQQHHMAARGPGSNMNLNANLNTNNGMNFNMNVTDKGVDNSNEMDSNGL